MRLLTSIILHFSAISFLCTTPIYHTGCAGLDNDVLCNDCKRCVWDPIGGGFMMHCYGNDIEVRVHRNMKSSFLVKECRISFMKTDEEKMSVELMERAHRQYSGMPKVQSSLDMF